MLNCFQTSLNEQVFLSFFFFTTLCLFVCPMNAPAKISSTYLSLKKKNKQTDVGKKEAHV